MSTSVNVIVIVIKGKRCRRIKRVLHCTATAPEQGCGRVERHFEYEKYARHQQRGYYGERQGACVDDSTSASGPGPGEGAMYVRSLGVEALVPVVTVTSPDAYRSVGRQRVPVIKTSRSR